MFLTQRTITLAAAGPKGCLLSPCANSSENPRPLAMTGTRNTTTCADLTIRVTFYEANGTALGQPVGPFTPSTIEDQFWDHTLTVPDDAVSCMIEVFCGGVLQQTIPGVSFAAPTPVPVPETPVIAPSSPVFTALGSGTSLVMTIKNPGASTGDDSDTLVITRHTGHGQSSTFLPHYHTPHPGSGTRTISVGSLSPGRYVTKLVHVTPTAVKTYSGAVVKIV